MAGVFCLAAFVSLATFGGKRALLDGDTLWHIKMGEVMLQKGEILRQDLFSHTVYGKDWTAHEWLAEIIMALIHRLSGLTGIVIFHCLLAALTFWLLFRIAERLASDTAVAISLSLSLVLAMTHFLARPHLFTWLFAALSFYILLRGSKSLFLLPVITALWTNLHGGFVAGLMLQGIFLASAFLENRPRLSGAEIQEWGRKQSTPITVFLLSLLAVGINPFGYSLLLFPFHVSAGVFSAGIGEWRSPNFQQFWHFRFYLLLILALLGLGRWKLTWTDGLLLIFWVNAALVHQRHVSMAALFLAPCLARGLDVHLQSFIQRRASSKGSRDLRLSTFSGPFSTILAASVLIAICTGASTFEKKLYPLPESYSQGAIAYLEKSLPEGNLLNEYSWGDFLLYALEPPPAVFIDGRADMYGEKIFGDYRSIAKLDEATEELLDKYSIDWVLFPASHILVRYLKATGNWQEVYRDDQASILVSASSPPTELTSGIDTTGP